VRRACVIALDGGFTPGSGWWPGALASKGRRPGSPANPNHHRPQPFTLCNASSGYVCPRNDPAESFVVGVVVAPDDVAADHDGLLFVGGVVGAVEREVPQAVNWASIRFNQDELVGV
jgi:hypothetical protein